MRSGAVDTDSNGTSPSDGDGSGSTPSAKTAGGAPDVEEITNRLHQSAASPSTVATSAGPVVSSAPPVPNPTSTPSSSAGAASASSRSSQSWVRGRTGSGPEPGSRSRTVAPLSGEHDVVPTEAHPTGRMEAIKVPAERTRSELGRLTEAVPGLKIQALAFYSLVMAGLVAGSVLLALIFSFTQPPVYGARTDILFELDANLQAGFLREDRRLTTQVVTIESRAVLTPAAAQLGIDVEDLSAAIDASVIDGSEIIQITAEGSSGQEALDRLDAVVGVYFDQLEQADSSAQALALIADELTDLEQQEADLEARIANLVGGQAPVLGDQTRLDVGDAEVAVLLGDLQTVRSRIADLEQRRDDQELNDLIKPRFVVLTPAFVLDGLLAPNRLQLAALGALLGGMVGAGVVFGLERRNPRLR